MKTPSQYSMSMTDTKMIFWYIKKESKKGKMLTAIDEKAFQQFTHNDTKQFF